MIRWRLLYRVGWELAFASHLDRWRALCRSARRAGLPLAYSQGFHQRPRLAMGPPLPVGARGEEELADLYLEEGALEDLCSALNVSACPGLEVRRAWPLPLEEPSLTACSYHARWRLDGRWERAAADDPAAESWIIPPAEAAVALLAAPSLPLHRITPKGEKDIEVREYLLALQVGMDFVEVELLVTPSGGVRWEEICALFQQRGYHFRLCGLCRTSLRRT